MRHVFGLLGEGRGAFLEFLRNLTPQFLFLGVAIKIGLGLDFTAWDTSNWFETFVFVACAALFTVSFFANSKHFTHSYAEAMNQAAFQHADQGNMHRRAAHHKDRLFRSRMKRYGPGFAQTALVISIVIQASCAAVVWLAFREYARSSS